MAGASLEFHFGSIPDSVNSLYVGRGGRRFLSSAGKKYKNKFISSMGGADPADVMAFSPDRGKAYCLELWFFLPRKVLFNDSYGKDKRVKYPFKNMDVSNLIKLAEDSISSLLSLSDRCNFTVIAHKRVGDSCMVARLSPLDLDNDPYEYGGAA